MTQAELAQMAPMMGDGYNNPLEMSALTQGTMGYLPNAQMMTPSSMGAFRTLPNMAYQQPVNQQAGYLKSLGTAALSSYGFNYNPAVNPILQRVEAERLVHDTNTSTWGAAGATALDFALPAIAGYIGKGLKVFGKMPLVGGLASGVGGMLMPLTIAAQMASSLLGFEGVQDKIANTRALQRLTRGKIVSGNSIDEGMMSGFSTKAAREIDKHLYRTGLMDGVYDQEDYRRMLSEGVQAGMFDYANTPEQYKKTLKNIRDNMSTVMEVTGSQEFSDIMKELKRLQDMGATQQQYKSILRKENMYARITGLSHSDLVNTYGQMGALEFSQRGLNQMAGSQAAMHNAAVVTMMQRNGQLSNVTLAANGGVSGLAQQITASEADAKKGVEEPLLLALIDPATGKLKKNAKELFNSYFKSGSDGINKLAQASGVNAKTISSDFNLRTQFNNNYADNATAMWNTLGDDAMMKMFIMYGRKLPGSERWTNRELAIHGAEAAGYSSVAATTMVNGYTETQKQREAEKKMERARRFSDHDKEYNLFSRGWRSIKRFFMPTINSGIDEYTDRELEEGDAEAAEINKIKYARGITPVMANIIAAQDKKQKAADSVKTIVDTFSKSPMVTIGDSVKGLDITPMIKSMMTQIVKATNRELGSSYYTQTFERILNATADGRNLKAAFEKVGKDQVKALTKHTKRSDIKEGTVFFNGDNAVAIYQGGKVLSADEQGNTKSEELTDFVKNNVDKNLEMANMNALNESTGGGSADVDLLADEQGSAKKLPTANMFALTMDGKTVSSANAQGSMNYDTLESNTEILKAWLSSKNPKDSFEDIRKFYKEQGVNIGSYEEFEKFLANQKDNIFTGDVNTFGENVQAAVTSFANATGKDENGEAVDLRTSVEANTKFVNTPFKAFTAATAVLNSAVGKESDEYKAVMAGVPIAKIGNQTSLQAMPMDTVSAKDMERKRLLNAVEFDSIDTNRSNMESSLTEILGEGTSLPNENMAAEIVKKVNPNQPYDTFEKDLEDAKKIYVDQITGKDGKPLSDEQKEALLKNTKFDKMWKTYGYSYFGTETKAYEGVKTEAVQRDTIGQKQALASNKFEDTLTAVSSLVDEETGGQIKNRLRQEASSPTGATLRNIGLASGVAGLKKMSENAYSDSAKQELSDSVAKFKKSNKLSKEQSEALDVITNSKSSAEDIKKAEQTLFGKSKKTQALYEELDTALHGKNSSYQGRGVDNFVRHMTDVNDLPEMEKQMKTLQTTKLLTDSGYMVYNGQTDIALKDLDLSKLTDENRTELLKRHKAQGGKDNVRLSLSDVNNLGLINASQRMQQVQQSYEAAAGNPSLFDEAESQAKKDAKMVSYIKQNTDAMVQALNDIKDNTTSTAAKLYRSVVGGKEKKENELHAGARS